MMAPADVHTQPVALNPANTADEAAPGNANANGAGLTLAANPAPVPAPAAAATPHKAVQFLEDDDPEVLAVRASRRARDQETMMRAVMDILRRNQQSEDYRAAALRRHRRGEE